MSPTRKILSIDGGGLKGIFPASFLSALEEDLQSPIGSYFDLIVGTSTGGIIAAGLGLGLEAGEVQSFYREYGERIFPRRALATLSAIRRAKYDPEPLREALTSVFSDSKLGDCKTRVVIPSLNLETGEVHVYKTSHHPRFTRDFRLSLVDVCMATAAAPTYFPAYTSHGGLPLIDGGMWANNPVGPAAVEAVGVLDWPRDNLSVLSIGCTSEPLDAKPRRPLRAGFFHWAWHLTSTFMAGQSSASNGTANLLAGHENVFRYNPSTPAGRYKLDSIEGMEGLAGLGYSEARKATPSLTRFFEEEAPPFKPYNQ